MKEDKMYSENSKEMKALKEEYMNCKLPEDGLERLEKTITQAKKDKKRQQKLRYFRNTAAGMAAAFAGLFVMVNVNSDIAYAMEQIPVLGRMISVITLDHYQTEGERYSADIKTPKLESEDKTPGIDKVNEAVKEDTEALIQRCKEEFAEEMGNHSIDADYRVMTDTDDWFALELSITETSASAQQRNKYYNIDRRTGEMVYLKDLFREGSDYAKLISENIKEQMRSQMAEDENIMYFLESEVPEWDFKQIGEKQNFYINEKGELVISFDEYEAAPGYMGSVSFVIPSEVTAPLRK